MEFGNDENIFAIVKMPFALYKEIKDQYPDMDLKNIKDMNIDYSKHPEWNEAKKMLVESVRNIEHVEESILFKITKK